MPRENLIKIRRGSQATISGITLGLSEPGFTTDTKRLYIGDGLGNNLIGPYDDHGMLNGLSDDDHPQYILADGSRGFINTVSGVEPVNAYDLTTKGYVETLISGTGNIYFGSDIEYITNETQSSTNSTSWQQKIKLTSTDVETGAYRVGWSFEWRLSNTLGTFYSRVQYDDTQDLFSRTYSSSGDVTIWNPISDFYYLDTVVSGIHTFDIDYHSSSIFTTAYIRNARIEFWRVS